MIAGERDHLTGLLTRAEFDSALRECLSGATEDHPAGLVFVDIDHFKKINDQHGHPAGDQVLRGIAERLSSIVQGKGQAYRYGGEEFAMILPNHTPHEALSVAERARLSVDARPVSGFSVTCSLGVAIAPHHASTPEAWLKSADEAMYDAKRLGRNLVRLTGEAAPAPNQASRPSRKQAQPGTLSDEAKEELRLEILRHGGATCPIDEIPLEVQRSTTFGESGESLYVYCPGCGFNTSLPGPGR